MPEILWAFDCLESKEMGAYPPSKIRLAYANRLQKKKMIYHVQLTLVEKFILMIVFL
ncbi:hypothetical protein MWQ_12300 [Acinetobacter seifertii]|nr:hypothetical protein MWQ_12300 [Acinetobacter seifertii]